MGETYVLRGGKSVRADEVFAARSSGDLQRMLGVLGVKTNPIDRHFLLMDIVAQTYRRRREPRMAQECSRVAELHLAEFSSIAPALKKEMGGILPMVTTFQHYATHLTEQGRFDRAIEVCKSALSYGLHDGTQSGYGGRIQRIEKLRAKSKRS